MAAQPSSSRRTFCAEASAGLALLTLPSMAPAHSQTDNASGSLREAPSRIASAFMTNCSVPGMSVAIARHQKIIYEQAFGYADLKKKEPVTGSSLFRIASVTKPITSVAIFSLIEQQRLSLDAKVFGPVLGTTYGRPPYDAGVERITIEHLLTHTCGGWDKNHDDPMFQNPDMDHRALTSATLKNRPLDFAPGTHYAYSNFGFCVPGRVIEKVTGTGYADYVREGILKRCEIDGMRIAGNGAGKRAANEVRYYDQEGGDPYGLNVSRLDSAGGWLATPRDMVRFAMHVNGFPADSNILKPETIAVTTTGTTANPHYAKGWEVNQHGRWHIGDLQGSSVLACTSTGYCWAAFMNTRRMKPDIRLIFDRTMWDMVRSVSGSS